MSRRYGSQRQLGSNQWTMAEMQAKLSVHWTPRTTGNDLLHKVFIASGPLRLSHVFSCCCIFSAVVDFLKEVLFDSLCYLFGKR